MEKRAKNRFDIAEQISYAHSRNEEPKAFDFHLHNSYEVYFFIAGSVHYFVDQHVYHLQPGDVLVFNSNEIHRPTFKGSQAYERYVLHFNPELVRRYAPPEPNLLACFELRRSSRSNLIRMSRDKQQELTRLFDRLCAEKGARYGGDTAKIVLLLEVLLLLGEWTQSHRSAQQGAYRLKPQVAQVIDYVNENLEQELSLSLLAKKLYINKNYLCRIFKEETGNTLNNYIRLKRVARAKTLLSEGFSVAEVCVRAGFGDYSSFIRTFREITGYPPGKYRSLHEGLG